MEQPVPADLPRLKRRGRIGKALAPYLLLFPGGMWLAIFFVVPLAVMFSVSLYTGSLEQGYKLTWNFGIYGQVLSEHGEIFVRSLIYSGIATVICLVVAYPMAYWIAFYGGRRKNTFLLLLLLPFFVSFVIRTLSWGFILSDDGIIFGTLKSWHLLPQSFHILATSTAVISGIAYNFLPFMALPLYVSLEKIDRRVVEAAGDLYASKFDTFRRVILPLSIPGVFAGVLLTFVPATGDYVNATILGGTGNHMIGNIIQQTFLENFDYPAASAMSFILMTILLVGIFIYARALGTRNIQEYV